MLSNKNIAILILLLLVAIQIQQESFILKAHVSDWPWCQETKGAFKVLSEESSTEDRLFITSLIYLLQLSVVHSKARCSNPGFVGQCLGRLSY